MQIISGIRSILSNPLFYIFFHKITNVYKHKTDPFVQVINKNKNKIKVLDIGCGPCEILELLKDNIEYYGIDTNKRYIDYAKKKYKRRGFFINEEFSKKLNKKLPKFNYVIMCGLIHHLDEKQINLILKNLRKNINKKTLILTLDPLYTENQNYLEKKIMGADRGQNIRNEKEITNLFRNFKIKKKIFKQIYIPYTWIFLKIKI